MCCVYTPGGIRTNFANTARITDVSMVADSDQEMGDAFARLARTSPTEAATVIIQAMQTRKKRVLIGADAKVMDLLFRVVPSKASHWVSLLGQRLRASEKARNSLK